LKRCLTGCGVQPRQGGEPLEESDWWSAAVEPTTGEACWGELPPLDAACFGSVLATFGQADAERRTSVLLDQAPAPGAQRVPVPEKVVLVWWPA